MQAMAVCRYTMLASVVLILVAPRLSAQDDPLQQRVAALKDAAMANRHALAQYTWQQIETVSIKGDVKKTEKFQVRFLPDGTQQKTPIDPDKPQVVEKETKDYEDYGKKLAALAHLYAHPDPTRLQTAYRAGKVSVGPTGNPDEARLVIQDYAKTGDTVTISFDQAQNAVTSVQVQSYLDVPDDKASIVVKFARIPDGPHYPQNIGIEGVSKQFAVGMVNSDYRKIQSP
jgi:hypothetical protein